LESGQTFRFKSFNDGYQGVALGKEIFIKQEDDKIEISSSDSLAGADFNRYFSLDIDYKKIKKQLSLDPTLEEIVEFAPGIRVMRQPVFETLITFIISQNNNIPRISGIVERLCDNFGEDKGGYRDFPTAGVLSELSPEDLAPIRAGFRDKYIIDAAIKWTDGIVREEFLKTAPLDSARDMLMKIKGVGPKVADCVLLFSANRLETFPKDVWIKRAMESLFPDGLPECAREYAGIAQQYIFHYARNRQII